MKHLKLFVALFAMLALGVTNAWAEEVTFDWNGSATATGGKTDYVVEQSPVTLTFALGTAQNAPRTNKEGSVRMYTGTTLTISCASGNITKVIFTPTGAGYDATKLKYGESALTSDEWTLSSPSNEVKLTASANARFKKIVVTYTQSSDGGDEPADVIVKTLKSIAVEGATSDYETGDIFKFDGTCTATYSVTKNDVAQDDETKVVTPTSVSTPDMSTAGEKEVTVTYTEDDVTVTATYTITVTENVITAGEYELALNNTFFGTAAAANVSAFPTSAKQDDITVTLNGGGTKTRTDADCVRMYQNNTLTFSVPAGYVINSIVFTAGGDWKGSISVNAGTYTDDTKSWAGSAQEVVFSFGAQNRIATATVTYAAVGETPEVPTIDAPTFSLAAGKYNEEQEVTLSAEEGTIYYTLDGTTPTADSEEYTEAIVLDECGEITIKAIAISGETTSSVASATYTIKLPLNNSQANPYTEAEAIEVFNGGCYDEQMVYVKGVVANAQFYSSNSYTITLEGGFMFYKFYEAAGDTQFTEDYIQPGDTLVACGKLSVYNSKYQLAAGCYLVEYKAYSVPKVDISNTPETAYTVAEAIALIDNVTSDLTKQVYVKGEISEVESFNDNYGNITYWIQDEEGNKFECYGGLGLNQEQFTSIDDLVVGSQVVVYGTMKKYNSIYEFNHSNYIVSLTLPSYTVTVSANLAEAGTVTGGGSFEHGAEATLTATPADGYVFVNWTENEVEVSADAEYTFEVLEDRNLVANFKEAEPEIESTWTVAGAPIFDAHWDPAAEKNDMTLQEDGTYKWEKTNLEIAANTPIEFKVVKDHTWGEAYPSDNYNLSVNEDGIYTITIIFDPTSKEVTAVAIKTGDAEINVTISYVLMGVAGDWTTGITLTQNPENVNEYVLLGQQINEGDAVKVVTLTDGVATAWCGNVDEWSVENTFDENGNIVLEPGKYDFYFKVLDNLIYIGKTVEPEVPTALDNIDSTVAPIKAIVNGQLIIIKNGVQYNAQGAVVK